MLSRRLRSISVKQPMLSTSLREGCTRPSPLPPCSWPVFCDNVCCYDLHFAPDARAQATRSTSEVASRSQTLPEQQKQRSGRSTRRCMRSDTSLSLQILQPRRRLTNFPREEVDSDEPTYQISSTCRVLLLIGSSFLRFLRLQLVIDQ